MATISINNYLRELAFHTSVKYCPNPGNAGDALIAQATFQLFGDCQIDYAMIDPKSFTPQGEVVFYAGGGNLTRYYQKARPFIQRVHAHVSKLIILPHTIDSNEDLLAELGNNVDVICREEVSYRHVQRYAKDANVYLADDMAFLLKLDKVMQSPLRCFGHCSPALFMWRSGLQRRNVKSLLDYLQTRLQVKRTGILNAFRTDVETTNMVIPPQNYDISKAFTYGTSDKYSVLLSCKHLLQLVGSCRQLRTNRLHIAIAGARLGKEVWFYANSYYKNQAVYEFSIKPRFPNVLWKDLECVS